MFEAFAGYGSQLIAMRRLEKQYPDKIKVTPVGFSEIEPAAIKAYHALHGDVPNFGDICSIDWAQVPDFELFTYSFPCFVAGTLILTDNGYKPIENIEVGDMVLTHTNQYKRVTRVSKKTYDGTMAKIYGMGTDLIYCTEEHPFYIRRMYRKGHEWERCFHEPEWIKAKNLDKNTYIGYAINTKSEMPKWDGVIDNRWGHGRIVNNLTPLFNETRFWYIMGRYVGDGWKRNSDSGRGIVICCSQRNRKTLEDALNEIGWHFTASEERTVTKLIISMNELYEFVGRYGYYAHGKKIDAETLNLPPAFLQCFIKGYIDSDGYFGDNLYKISSVSRELCFGIAQCVAKAYKRPFSIYKTTRLPQTTIEGRVVSQKDTYTITWKLTSDKQDKAFYEDGYIWYPLTKLPTFQNDKVEVFNMSVEEDESYTANGAIVHNCTDISAAGMQQGFSKDSGTRSSLLWECERAVAIKRPKYLLMENVKALVQSKFIKGFHEWLRLLESYGYYNFSKVLNSKDFGVAQNRERIFVISILATPNNPNPRFHFPQPFPLTKRLKDYLEENVSEKYYLSDKMLEYFQRVNEDDTAFTIRTKPGTRVDDNYLFDE